MRGRYIYLAVGFLVTSISFWLLSKSVPYDEMARALRASNFWWLVPNLALGFLAMWLQAVRWRTLISPLKSIPILEIFTATSIGLLVNNVLPFRLGEYARVFVLSRRNKSLSTSSLLATVMVERLIFDLGFLAFVVLGVFYFIPLHQQMDFGVSAFIIVIILAILLVFIIATAVSPQKTINSVFGLLLFLPHARRLSFERSMNQFAGAVLLLKRQSIILKGFVLTFIVWLLMAMSIYCLFMAFAFHLPFTASFVLLAAVTLAMFIPSLPGYIGIFHLAAVITLSTYNISDADARAFSIILHLTQYIPTTIMGLFFLNRINLSLGLIRKNVMDETIQRP